MIVLSHQICKITCYIALISGTGCNNTPVIYPERKNVIETVYASGKIISANEYKLVVLRNGTVIKRLVKDGDTVKKGQLLYIINSGAAKVRADAALKNYQVVAANLYNQSPLLNDLKLSLQNAAVKCSNDFSTYHRYKNLWAQNIGNKSNLDNAYVNYQLSQHLKKSLSKNIKLFK